MPKPDSVPHDCLAEVERAYADLDADLAALGFKCRACGKCCDLVKNRYRLYLSTLELALILERCGIDRLPPGHDGRCGFQRDGRCTIHKVRPLGCRTFFCDADGRHLTDLYEKYLKRLRSLADANGCPWDYSQKYPESP